METAGAFNSASKLAIVGYAEEARAEELKLPKRKS